MSEDTLILEIAVDYQARNIIASRTNRACGWETRRRLFQYRPIHANHHWVADYGLDNSQYGLNREDPYADCHSRDLRIPYRIITSLSLLWIHWIAARDYSLMARETYLYRGKLFSC